MSNCKKCAEGILRYDPAQNRWIVGVAHDIRHGTSSGYVYHGCRCGICKGWQNKKHLRDYPKRAEKMRAHARAYYRNNKERHKAVNRAWELANREKVQEQRRERYRRDIEKSRADARVRDARYREQGKKKSPDNAQVRRARIEKNQEYYRELDRRKRERRKAAFPAMRSGAFSPAEDAIICDPTLTIAEQASMLQRNWTSIQTRRWRLHQKGLR